MASRSLSAGDGPHRLDRVRPPASRVVDRVVGRHRSATTGLVGKLLEGEAGATAGAARSQSRWKGRTTSGQCCPDSSPRQPAATRGAACPSTLTLAGSARPVGPLESPLGIDLHANGVRARDFLGMVLKPLGLACKLQDGTVMVTDGCELQCGFRGGCAALRYYRG